MTRFLVDFEDYFRQYSDHLSNVKTTLFHGYGLLLALLVLGLVWTGCDSAEVPDEELLVEDIIIGPPAVAEHGVTLRVHYTGWLENGTRFGSSYDSGQPYEFVLGTGEVIEGWDQGLVGMRVGGKRKLTIPPSMAYGEEGAKDSSGNYVIPPDSRLIYEVELVEVRERQTQTH